jgi:general stress protein 26
MPSNRTHQEDLAKLEELIEDIDFCMLTTVDAEGALRSRPMSTQRVEKDGGLWFFTSAETVKVDELAADSRVNLSYADKKKARYVSVSGTAEVFRDRAKIKELWNPVLKAWFPKGPDDPALVLLKVTIDDAEYWDDASSSMVRFFKLARAAATGRPYEAENRKVDVDRPDTGPVRADR